MVWKCPAIAASMCQGVFFAGNANERERFYETDYHHWFGFSDIGAYR